MTYPRPADPETWGRALVAYDPDPAAVRIRRCRHVPHLRAAASAEADRVQFAPRPDRIARINQRIRDLQS